MTQEPDTIPTEAPYAPVEKPTPAALAAQLSAALESDSHDIRSALDQGLGAISDTQHHQHALLSETLASMGETATALESAVRGAAEKAAKEFARVKQQADARQEQTAKRIVGATTAVKQHIDTTGEAIEQLRDDGAEHYRLTGTVLSKVNELPENLHDHAERTAEQIGLLREDTEGHTKITGAVLSRADEIHTSLHEHTQDARQQIGALAADGRKHQALTRDALTHLAQLPGVITGEGTQTRTQLGEAIVLVFEVLESLKGTRTDVKALETALAMVIGATRDQILDTLNQHLDDSAASHGHNTERLIETQRALDALNTTLTADSEVLAEVRKYAGDTWRTLPEATARVLENSAAESEATRRAVLDVEGRISSALSLTQERTERVLVQTSGDVKDFAASFDAFAEHAATGESVEKVRGDVTALSELLATSTEEFAGAVQQSVSDMVQMRTAWSQETSTVLSALEQMGRIFLEKANSSEYARDQSVIELGRRVARLELERAPEAVTVS